jgi:hypothetical protein
VVRYAVVLLMASHCPEMPDGEQSRCVMDVIGCEDREQAQRIAGTMPSWTVPHILPVSQAADFEPG